MLAISAASALSVEPPPKSAMKLSVYVEELVRSKRCPQFPDVALNRNPVSVTPAS